MQNYFVHATLNTSIDFGEDPEIDSAIEYREQLVARMRQVVELSGTLDPRAQGVVSRELVNLTIELRDAGIRCVKKIVAWTIKNTPEGSDAPAKYLWKNKLSDEYLIKMLHDLDFIGERISSQWKLRGKFCGGDPLFLSKTSGENAADRRAAIAATVVILDAVSRNKRISSTKASFARRQISAQNTQKNLFDTIINSRAKGVLESTVRDDVEEISHGNQGQINFKGLTLGSSGSESLRPSNSRGKLNSADEEYDNGELEKGIGGELGKPERGSAGSRSKVSQKLQSHSRDGSKDSKIGKEYNIFRGKFLYRQGAILGRGAYSSVSIFSCNILISSLMIDC